MQRLDEASDDALIRALSARYRPAIIAYFVRRIGDRAEAEDMAQDVFASLVRRAELASIENIEGYIFRAAANLLRQRARTAGRRPNIWPDGSASSDLLVDELTPAHLLEGREDWQMFVQTLYELPERTRTIFVLNRFEELTGREIAIRLGISVSLVEKEMIRAITFLRSRAL